MPVMQTELAACMWPAARGRSPSLRTRFTTKVENRALRKAQNPDQQKRSRTIALVGVSIISKKHSSNSRTKRVFFIAKQAPSFAPSSGDDGA